METEILEQIIISIEAWDDLEKIGEEVRPLEDAIRSYTLNDIILAIFIRLKNSIFIELC
jgi:hypothetical protein